MSASTIYYTDPQLSTNVQLRTDLIGGVHTQFLKLMDGTIGGTAGIPGDATSGLFVQIKDAENMRAIAAETYAAGHKIQAIGGVRYDTQIPDAGISGGANNAYVPLALDQQDRLQVNSMRHGGYIKFGEQRLQVKRLAIGKSVAYVGSPITTALVPAVSNKKILVLQIFLTFSAVMSPILFDSVNGVDAMGDSGLSAQLAIPASGQINLPFCQDGIFESGTSGNFAVKSFGAGTIAGFILYAEAD